MSSDPQQRGEGENDGQPQPLNGANDTHIVDMNGTGGTDGGSNAEGDGEAKSSEYKEIKQTLTRWQKFNDWRGGFETFMAMVPQGIFGMLLLDKHLYQSISTGNKDVDSGLRVALDFLTFIAAEEGKRCIVRYYNTSDFQNYGEILQNNLTGLLNIVTLKHKYKWSDIVSLTDKFQTVVMASLFAGLAYLAFDGAAGLLDDLNAPSEVSDAFRSLYVKAPFMLCAFDGNLLAFPNIHKYGLGALFNTLRQTWNLLFNQTVFAEEVKISNTIEELRLYVMARHAYEKSEQNDRQWDNKPSLSKLRDDWKMSGKPVFALTETDQRKVYDWATNNGNLNILLLEQCDQGKLRGSWERGLVILLKSACVVGGCVGLYNFKDMSNLTIGELPYIGSVSTVTQWTALGSMWLMAINSIQPLADGLVSFFTGRHSRLRILSTCKYVSLVAWVLFIGALGGTPNAFQAELAGEDLAMLVMAAFASFAIEVPGLDNILLNGARQHAANSTDTDIDKIALELDTQLAHLRDSVEYVPDEEKHILDREEGMPASYGSSAPPPPQDSPKPKPSRSCCGFFSTCYETVRGWCGSSQYDTLDFS